MSTYSYEQDGVVKRTSSSFFRGENCNFWPDTESLNKPDVIEKYLLLGWTPSERFVTRDTPIVAFGSCFADNISKYLHGRDYNVLTKRENKAHITKMGDGIVHTHAIRQQFEWAWEKKVPSQALWHGYKTEDFGYGEEARRDTEELFNKASLFIITLGLSEIWYDEPTGEVFWRAVPLDKVDPSRHKFRVASHAETLDNLRAIHRLIRQHRPDAKLLFTVSPVPLTATFRSVSCLTANAVSKAKLRSALDELLQACDDPNVGYFPSYEIVLNIFNNQWIPDRKHVHQDVLAFNMKAFEYFYCSPGISREELYDAFDYARTKDWLRGHSPREGQPEVDTPEAQRQAKIDARVQARAEERERLRQERIAARVAARSA